MTIESFDDVRAAVKRVGALLRDADVDFMVAGGLACWARGGPPTEHDVDLVLTEEYAEKALVVLDDAGLRTDRPAEGWLYKAWVGDVLVDLIFSPSGPDSPEARATANLRSSLWRAHQSTPKMIDAAGQHLRLAELVEVDVREVISLATRIVDDRSVGPNDFESAQQLIASTGDLLPDWYEDWVQFKREHLRQLNPRLPVL